MLRKAQAAMEFLMTYGWAILVVLVVLGALTYFGVLSPQTLLPSRCDTGETWLKCKDYKIDSTNNVFIVTLENNWQYDIEITGITLNSSVHSCSEDYTASPIDILQGAEAQFRVGEPCSVDPIDAARVGKKVKSDLTIKWQRADVSPAIPHTMTGVLTAQVEK